MTPLLRVRDLRISFPTDAGTSTPVDGVTFTLARGETLALVGESGCGKTLTSLALLRLVPSPGRIEPGSSLRFGDQDILAMDPRALRSMRGKHLAMVFQDPMTSLNPVFTAGAQIVETIQAHESVTPKAARDRALALLREVGIPDPANRIDQYPHEMSGGMRQRVMIAMALATEPEVLIADEPTTALDVTVQAQILEILDRLQASHGLAILLITHDLGIVAGHADRVAVMYAGRIVEEAETGALFSKPTHPYTQGLLNSVPRLTGPRRPLVPIPGAVPDPAHWPPGCRFHPRCPKAMPRCRVDDPPRLEAGHGHHAACWLVEEAPA
ncbi:MAG TPA: ABC transporter ATP-binding protein [Gemmatimonadales bacterium]|nr:ABC transporter ATP-binding protein [Gemmatimonadales bacterium]